MLTLGDYIFLVVFVLYIASALYALEALILRRNKPWESEFSLHAMFFIIPIMNWMVVNEIYRNEYRFYIPVNEMDYLDKLGPALYFLPVLALGGLWFI